MRSIVPPFDPFSPLWMGLVAMLGVLVFRLIVRARAGRAVTLSAEVQRLAAGSSQSAWQLTLVNTGTRPLFGGSMTLVARSGTGITGHGALLHPAGSMAVHAHRGPDRLDLSGIVIEPGGMLTVTLTFAQAQAPGVDWKLLVPDGRAAISRPGAPAGQFQNAITGAVTLAAAGIAFGPLARSLVTDLLRLDRRLAGTVGLAVTAGLIIAAALRLWP
ncbi:MAG: hypothetical protein R6X13_04305, partial [bacterium]